MEPFKLPKRLWLKNARLIDPAAKLDARGDLLIENGRIAEVKSGSGSSEGWDLNGAIVCPGFFDLHVHLREPGNEDAETIRSGQEAAAAGAFTAVAAMPNTNPPLDHAGIVRWIIERAAEFPVAVHPVAAITRGRKGEELTEMVELREAGAIAFSDDGGWVQNAGIMRRALEYSQLTGAPIISHAEDATLSQGGAMNEGEMSTRLGLPGIPRISEDAATLRDLLLAEYVGGKLHLAHVSTAGAVAALQGARGRGVHATGEAAPHHLTLTDQAVAGYHTSTKMKPPLREEADRLSLWEALKGGVLSAIATDHAPHAIEDKEVPYDEASFGTIGLETAVALVWDRGVQKGLITPAQMISLFCNGPRSIVGLPIPAIAKGAPAELSIFHPEETWEVDVRKFFGKSANCPYSGWKLTGRPWGIIKGAWWAGRVEAAV